MSAAAGAYLLETDAALVYSFLSEQALRRAMAAKGGFRAEHRNRTADGGWRWEEVHGAVF